MISVLVFISVSSAGSYTDSPGRLKDGPARAPEGILLTRGKRAVTVGAMTSHSCTPEQALRLGKAIAIRTITPLPDAPGSDPGYAAFEDFVGFLREQFPLAASRLQWERIGPLALLITWKGTGADAPLVLYAHCDVVPSGVEAAWSHLPFSGIVADGYVWGRGSLDDKGSLLAVMESVEALLEQGFVPARTVNLAFGGDEELNGVRGAAMIAAELMRRGVRPYCLIDEGSVIADGALSMVKRPLALVGIAEKGFANARLTVTGVAGHSAMPGRGTAAGALGAALAALERRPFPLRLTPTVRRFFHALAPHVRPVMGAALRLIGPLWPVLKWVLAADPSTDSLLRTTQAVTMLRAGERPNVLPGEASAIVNLRILPGESTATALQRIRRVAEPHVRRPFALRVEFPEGAEASEPVPELGFDQPLWSALRDCIAEAAPEAAAVPFLVVMATDSRKFAAVADSIVRFMPAVLKPSDIALIHGVDERISLENYGRMIMFYGAFIRRIAR
jgi:carboxypeptidase PM20D1